jgi:hypothetical protein
MSNYQTQVFRGLKRIEVAGASSHRGVNLLDNGGVLYLLPS